MGLNVGGMWLGYTGDTEFNKGHPNQFQRGVHFKHLACKSDELSILPHPAFSDRLMEYMRRATRIRVPPRNLILTPEGMAKQPKSEPTINALCTYTASFGRQKTTNQVPFCCARAQTANAQC